MSAVNFKIKNLFSMKTRDRFVTNLKKVRFPFIDTKGVQPTGTAAVLIPLCGVNDVPSLLFTLRSDNLKRHSGQISFPGGKTDNNETPTETALRETQEEIGLSPGKVDVWGFGPIMPSQDFKIMVTPIIGCVADLKENDLCRNTNEVNKIFTVPLKVLCDPKNQFHNQYSKNLILPVFMVNEAKIWGMTAYLTHMVLSCLLCTDLYKSDWMKRKIDIDER